MYTLGMYLGIDFGATKTLVAKLTPEGEIAQQIKFDTPAEYPDLVHEIGECANQLGGNFEIAAIGAPGVIDRRNGSVISYGNRDWQNTPLGADLEAQLTCRVIVENDGKTGAVSESEIIKNEFKNVLYLAIGTGIGIANVVDSVNNLDVADIGGHGLLVEHDGQTLPWEDFAGGRAITERFGKHASEITAPEDWQIIAHNLGVGILELLKLYQPEVIVFGGGVGSHFEHFKQPLQSELEKSNVKVPALRQAKDPELAVIHGCYLLIKQAEYDRTT